MDHRKLIIFTDGGSRGNPGNAAYGFVISDADRNIIYEEGKYIGIETNNVAEYMAVISALRWVRDNITLSPTEIQINLDSQLVERQMTGVYRIKNERIRALSTDLDSVIGDLQSHVSFHHIPREQNKKADALVNLALDKQLAS